MTIKEHIMKVVADLRDVRNYLTFEMQKVTGITPSLLLTAAEFLQNYSEETLEPEEWKIINYVLDKSPIPGASILWGVDVGQLRRKIGKIVDSRAALRPSVGRKEE